VRAAALLPSPGAAGIRRPPEESKDGTRGALGSTLHLSTAPQWRDDKRSLASAQGFPTGPTRPQSRPGDHRAEERKQSRIWEETGVHSDLSRGESQIENLLNEYRERRDPWNHKSHAKNRARLGIIDEAPEEGDARPRLFRVLWLRCRVQG
jgi:hypothetical protein